MTVNAFASLSAAARLQATSGSGFGPLAPILDAPPPDGVLDFTASQTFTWTPQAPNAAAQTAYAFRRYASPSGGYQWWNAGSSAWSATEVYNTSSTASATFSAGSWSNGQDWGWSVSTQNGTTLGGPYATNQIVTGAALPVVTFTGPTGTQTTGNWTITWTDSASTIQSAWRAVVYSSAQHGASGWTAGVGPSMADSGVVGGVASSYAVANLSPDTYWVCLQVTDLTGVTSAWTADSVVTSYTAPAAPTVSVVWSP
ncbi:MAG TPA: hypothetical protein VNF71_14435 [Acidimicrobiales bacterium]|nr:hypothetical protein [Acidimicrobiales bacterium]